MYILPVMAKQNWFAAQEALLITITVVNYEILLKYENIYDKLLRLKKIFYCVFCNYLTNTH